MLRITLVLFCMLLASCDDPPKAARYSTEALSQPERVAATSKLWGKGKSSLPSALEDAHVAEFAVGADSGFLAIGPTDYATYFYAKVPAGQIDAWRSQLVRLNAVPNYTAPAGSYPPWIGKNEFGSLEFFDSNALSGNTAGWIGVSREKGVLYMFTSTR